MAQDLVYAQKFPEALQIYQDLVADDPSDAQSYLRMSQIYRTQRKFTDARTASDKALAIDPANVEIRYNQVSILEAEGKTQQAIQTLKDILDTTAKSTYSRPERSMRLALLQRLAELYRDGEQTDLAVEAFRQMADLDADQGARAAAEIVETYRTGHDFARPNRKPTPISRNFRTTVFCTSRTRRCWPIWARTIRPSPK